MDWQGQKLAEEIMQWGVLAAAIVAFLCGYFTSSFKVMLVVYGVLILIVLVLVVPDWPFFNKNPLQWLDPKLAQPHSAANASASSPSPPDGKAQSAASKKASKPAKK
jgi:signal peptidase complex subunit 1